MSVRVKTKDAAKEIGCAAAYMEKRMKAGEWDLGEVVKPKKPGGRHTYYVFRDKLDRLLGRRAAEAE